VHVLFINKIIHALVVSDSFLVIVIIVSNTTGIVHLKTQTKRLMGKVEVNIFCKIN
jgi:hypothetical protein